MSPLSPAVASCVFQISILAAVIVMVLLINHTKGS
jgi:hypothetical protein